MKTVALLAISNIFMTFAWYGHLKYKDSPLGKVVFNQLADRVFGVLLSGSGQPHRSWSI